VEFAITASGQGDFKFDSEKKLSDFYQQMEGFTVWVEQAIENMKLGIKTKVVFPKVVVKAMVDRMNEYYQPDAEKSAFYQGAFSFTQSVLPESGVFWQQKYLKLIQTKVNPAYRKLVKFLEAEYMDNARDSISWSELPNGENWYIYRAKYFTTSHLSINEIHQMGLSEVSRIQSELEKLQNRTNLQQFNPIKRSNNSAKIIKGYEGLYKRTKSNIDALFNQRPKSELVFEPTNVVSHYKRGNLLEQIPGKFMVNTSGFSGFVVNSLFLHEAIPGHHYQISLQQEMDLPAFRRFGYMGAYSEGWGLYSESLGYQLGLYKHPQQERSKYFMELLRAMRLVVDTGVHGLGWNYEQALTYMSENGFRSKSELVRYIAMPGQALSYKVGELKILKLREQMQSVLKEDFDIKQFHGLILSQGAVPLFVLDEIVNSYLNSLANKE